MIKLKTQARKCKRIGISGQGGKGKSTAASKIFKQPIIVSLDGKFPIPSQPLVDISKPLSYSSMMGDFAKILNEPDLNGYDALVTDCMSKVLELCENHAIDKNYKGIRENYSSYSSGPNHELPQYFGSFLQLLEDIETKHEIDICLIIHTETSNALNPMGEDYSKIKLDLKKKPYAQLMKWLDCLGCIYDETVVEKDGLKTKAKTSNRVINFDNANPLFDGKSMGMTEVIAPFDINGNWYKTLFNKEVK